MPLDMSKVPFIDIAVQDTVREAMLDGKPAILFNTSISEIYWANGAAAQLFGYHAISAFEEAGLTPFKTTLRQLQSAAGRQPRKAQTMLLRVTAGLNSHLAKCAIQLISIEDYDPDLILLTFNRADEDADEAQLAQDALIGLEEDGAGVAIIDGSGTVIAQGGLFAKLNLSQAELAQLCNEVSGEQDRLVKRLVQRTAPKPLAVGIGRLSENPPRHIVVGIEADLDSDETVPQTQQEPVISAPTKPYKHRIDVAPPTVPETVGDTDEEDDFDFEDDDEAIIETEKANAKTIAQEGPVRFVWKTDSDGNIVEMSPELSHAVGAHAGMLKGDTLSDVLNRFGMDPSGEITASMQRRDTWSGKSVLWPIEDTDLRVPVDLAALPYYGRDRSFEGYRGFGIVRLADAVIDPEERGLSIGQAPKSSEESYAEEDYIEEDLAPRDDDPFEGEPPALQSSSITPLRRTADQGKVIPLDEHRVERNAPEALDDNEVEAFEKIRATLNQDLSDTETNIDQDTIGEDDDLYPNDELIEESEPTSEDIHAQNFDDIVENTATNIEDEKPIFEEFEPTQPIINDKGLGPQQLDELPLPLLIVRDEEALFGNQALAEMTGYDSMDALNEIGLSVLFGDEDVALQDEGQSADRGLAIVHADGTKIMARAHLQIVPWQDSRALMFAFEPQITEQSAVFRSGEDSLSAVSENLKTAAFDEVSEMRAILDTATDGVVVIAQDKTIRSINSSASALFGYLPEDVVGKSFSILFANESQRAAMDYLEGFSNNSVASLLNEGREVLARERNGGFLPLFMTIGRLPTLNGFCAVMRDITPWKQTEQALEEAKREAEEASKTKSDFLAKISHEIRTPLNAIIGFSELMRDERFGPIANARYKEYLTDINKSGRHVLDLVNDLLDISKIEAGEQELKFESVYLNEAISDAISMVQPQANRNRIIVRASLDTNLPSVVADTRSVKQILLNLLSNAVRYTGSGGQVVVSTNYTKDGCVVLRIADSGIGMSAKEIEKAMQPFQQVSKHANAEDGDGTGLGLPLTKALVEANRAEFSIASEPQRGTSVEVTFPSARVLAD